MSLDKFRAFYYTAILKTAKRACQELGVNSTSVTRAIRNLEEEIGHELFIVVKNRYTLTEKGKVFLEFVKTILAQYEASLKTLEAYGENQDAALTVSFPSFLSSSSFYKAFYGFMDIHPFISFTFKPTEDRPSLDSTPLQINLSIDPAERNTEETWFLKRYKVGLFASQAYLNKVGKIEETSQLSQHHLLAYSKEALFPYMEVNWLQTLMPPLKKTTYIESATDIFQAIQEGIGIGPICYPIDGSLGPDLVPILPKTLHHSFDLYFHLHKDQKDNDLIHKFFKYLQSYL